MLEFEWDAGKGVENTHGEATRDGGFIHCPTCGFPGLYYERMISGPVCVECGKEYENQEILKPIITVKR